MRERKRDERDLGKRAAAVFFSFFSPRFFFSFSTLLTRRSLERGPELGHRRALEGKRAPSRGGDEDFGHFSEGGKEWKRERGVFFLLLPRRGRGKRKE
jgi:hypothetical protein